MSKDQTTINPRKRPRQARAGATFDAILEAAARILEKDGIDSVNTNAVAELAGVSVGSLYQYFPTKESILAELVRSNRNILKEKVGAAVAGRTGRTLEESLDLLIEAVVSHQFKRPGLALALEGVESVLPLENETLSLTETIANDLEILLDSHNVLKPNEASRDIVALVRGIVDAAGVAKEHDQTALHHRVRRAVSVTPYADTKLFYCPAKYRSELQIPAATELDHASHDGGVIVCDLYSNRPRR